MGRERKCKKKIINKNDTKKARIYNSQKRSSLNKKDNMQIQIISEMIKNVLHHNKDIAYEDVCKSLYQLENLKLKTNQIHETTLCDKLIKHLKNIQMVIFCDSEILETNQTSNGIVISEIINNANKVINNTAQLNSEEMVLTKKLHPDDNIHLPTDAKIITENYIDQSQLPILEESEIIEIISDCSQETFCAELESKLVISESEINKSSISHNPEFNIKPHISNNTSVHDEASNLISKFNQQIKENIVENVPTIEIVSQDEILISDMEIEANIETRFNVPNNNLAADNNLKPKKYINTWAAVSNQYSNKIKSQKIIAKSKSNAKIIKANNLNSNNSVKQNSKTILAPQTQQFNYSPDDSSPYSEQFIHYSKQNKIPVKETKKIEISNDTNLNTYQNVSNVNTTPVIKNTLANSEKILTNQNINNFDDINCESVNTDNNLGILNDVTCQNVSDVTTINKTIHVVENTIANSVTILTYQNINNTDDIISESFSTVKNLETLNGTNLNMSQNVSDVITNKTIPVVINTLTNSVKILTHQNINNTTDIIHESVNEDKNFIQNNKTVVNKNNSIMINNIDTNNSHEIILENIITEKTFPEIEVPSSKINESIISEHDGQTNENIEIEQLQNFRYDKNESVLINIRKFKNTMIQKLLHLRDTHNNSDGRIFSFEQNENKNKNKFKSLFQKRNENNSTENSTLLKTNKNSPKNTNLDVYQDVEKFVNHQNRNESLGDNDNIQTTQTDLKDLMYNWTYMKQNFSEK